MNKFTMVLGAAAVATLAGCKDPDYVHAGATGKNEAKDISTEVVAPPQTPETAKLADSDIIVVKPIEQAPVITQTVKAKPVIADPEYTTYIVQNGDYLAKISKKYNVTISSIRRLNPSIKKDVIRVGQKIKLPGKVDVGVQSAPAKTNTKSTEATKNASKKAYQPYKGATKEYVVKSGDTLGSVAYGNGCNIRQLKELNGLTKDTLRIGQKLKVPASAESKTASAKKAETKPAAVEAKAKTTTVPPATESPSESTPAAAPVENATPAPTSTDAAAVPPSAPAPASAPATTTYVVQDGDDMTGVSIRWGVSAAEIRELNNLSDGDQLTPGQVIKLPADAQQ